MKASTHVLRIIVEHLKHTLATSLNVLEDSPFFDNKDEEDDLHLLTDRLKKILKTCFDALADLVYPPDEDDEDKKNDPLPSQQSLDLK